MVTPRLDDVSVDAHLIPSVLRKGIRLDIAIALSHLQVAVVLLLSAHNHQILLIPAPIKRFTRPTSSKQTKIIFLTCELCGHIVLRKAVLRSPPLATSSSQGPARSDCCTVHSPCRQTCTIATKSSRQM